MTSAKRWLSGAVILLLAAASPAWARGDATGAPSLADDPTLIALAVALACAEAPEAIEAAPQGPSGAATAGPELELVATVRAKTLVFDEVPKVDVVFRGAGKRKAVWKTERVNLPAHPEPGVVYRDVQVRLTLTSDVEELTSMLRDAKRASKGIRLEDAAAAVPPAPAATPAPSAPVKPTTTATAVPTATATPAPPAAARPPVPSEPPPSPAAAPLAPR